MQLMQLKLLGEQERKHAVKLDTAAPQHEGERIPAAHQQDPRMFFCGVHALATRGCTGHWALPSALSPRVERITALSWLLIYAAQLRQRANMQPALAEHAVAVVIAPRCRRCQSERAFVEPGLQQWWSRRKGLALQYGLPTF